MGRGGDCWLQHLSVCNEAGVRKHCTVRFCLRRGCLPPNHDEHIKSRPIPASALSQPAEPTSSIMPVHYAHLVLRDDCLSRYCMSDATNTDDLVKDSWREAARLLDTDPSELATTLLMAPKVRICF